MDIKPVYEFLVWDNCKNHCKFCFQRANPNILTPIQKSNSLRSVIKFIDSSRFISGSHVLIVGGELFDTQRDEKLLQSFFKKIVNRMLKNRIDLLYINTNLIYKNLTSVSNVLNLISQNNLFDRLRFTTSYDFDGRFKSKEDEQLMLSNLNRIQELYPKIQIVTNIILTKKACQEITNCPAVLLPIKTKWNLIPYIIYDPSMSATKDEIFKTLLEVDKMSPGYLNRYCKNLDLAQDKWLYKYDKSNNKLKFCSCIPSNCGHPINFRFYSTSHSCFICDIKKLCEVHDGLQ